MKDLAHAYYISVGANTPSVYLFCLAQLSVSAIYMTSEKKSVMVNNICLLSKDI